MDFSTALADIRRMAIDDRIRLVQAIWDEIAIDRAHPNLTEEQKAEIDRRLTDDDASPDDVISWETIKAEARARTRS